VIVDSLIHDLSWATAQHIFAVFAERVPEEERSEVFAAIYLRVKAGVECYQVASDRLARRLDPGKN
jgi:hypothetical protein